MYSNKISLYLIATASLLVAFGDLRNVTTPFGYWLLWSIWVVLSLLNSIFTKEHRGIKNLLGVQLLFIGLLVLCLGFFISALVNSDVYTIYQAVKILAIFTIGFFVLKVTNEISNNCVVKVSIIVIYASFAIFIMAQHLFPFFQVNLGDGRQGSLIAYPGVLWKAGCFFSAFALAGFLESRKLAFGSLIAYLVGAFLVISDGSRTGMMWLLIFSFIMISVRLINIRQNYSISSIVFYVSLVGMIVLIGVFFYSDQIASAQIISFERMGEFDSVRYNMIQSGIYYAQACLPFGCGFGTSISDLTGMVVHNSYLMIIGDVGVLGLVGLILILMAPIVVYFYGCAGRDPVDVKRVNYVRLASVLGLAGLAFSKMLHPLSTEMSEWGYYFLLFGFIYARAQMPKFRHA